MAAKKVNGVKEQNPVDTETTVERRIVDCNAQLITVDAGRLSKGLKTTFEGVAMVFDSIGLPVQLGLTMDLEDEEGASAEPAVAAESVESAAEKVAKKEAKDETEPVEAPVEKGAEATSAITIDDITKIIVQKIKQNRKNNEKIGAILKTYEVMRVGDLHPSKYEAFLTDISAI